MNTITFEDLDQLERRITDLEKRLTLHEIHVTTFDAIKTLQEKVEFLEHEYNMNTNLI